MSSSPIATALLLCCTRWAPTWATSRTSRRARTSSDAPPRTRSRPRVGARARVVAMRGLYISDRFCLLWRAIGWHMLLVQEGVEETTAVALAALQYRISVLEARGMFGLGWL